MTVPITTSTPPPAAAADVPTRAAALPWATSATRGPPATTTMKMPWSRPRTSSEAAVMEHAVAEGGGDHVGRAADDQHRRPRCPASARRRRRRTRPRRRSRSSPHPRRGSPRSPRVPAVRSGTPSRRRCRRGRRRWGWRRTAGRRPARRPPGRRSCSCAISGNSARGMPKTIAMMSTTNDIISTGMAAQVAEPVDDRLQARRGAHALDRQPRQPDHGHQRREQGDRVDQVEPREAEHRDQRRRRRAARRSRRPGRSSCSASSRPAAARAAAASAVPRSGSAG